MPATTSSHAASRTDPKHSPAKSRPVPPSRKTRIVRRRGGRGKDGFDSDEELVREVGTDSESDDDDRSSVGSSTDSDTEPVSEDVQSTGRSHILTPNTTQSSADVPSLNHAGSKPTKDINGQHASFFGGAGNWSEMVAEETANGPAELPVIEFAEFNSPSLDQRSLRGPPSRKPAKPSKRPPVKRAVSAPTVDRPAAPQSTPAPAETEQPGEHHDNEPANNQPVASTSTQPSRTGFIRRPPGHSARQAYQQRLETDPSYVPTVGEFWGHDDRLLDKDLRSLSGWWRGRWQGRGRGRGTFDRGFMRGRGRGGGFMTPDAGQRGSQSEEAQGPPEAQKPPAELPRIDQPWTHDGFEEMKKRDEKRREVTQQQVARPTRGFVPVRGRGGLIAGRGRGMVRGGGFAPSPTRAAFVPPTSTVPGRTWYAMKPERVWTKQHEAFLYFDSALKPRPGVGPGYRVKLSSSEAQVVRGPVRALEPPAEVSSSSQPPASEDGDKSFVVRLPKRTGKEKALPTSAPSSDPATVVAETRIEDVFTVRPELVPPRVPIVDSKPVAAPAKRPVHSQQDASSSAGPSSQPAASPAAATPSNAGKITSPLLNQFMREAAEAQSSLSAAGTSDGVVHEHYDNPAPTLLKADTPQAPEPQDVPTGQRALPVPPPLQTVFSPQQPSPPYGSPYGYGSPLPPGIAVSQHGMAYEVATGRPVYLPTPMYTPRPMAHGMMTPPGVSYMPGHMHHHSTGSPDFLAPPHTPPINGFIDPATGGPIFAFPRQSSRIEIRPPSSHADSKAAKSQRRPSGLRTTAAAFEPSRPTSPVNETHPFTSGTERYSHDGLDAQGEANTTSTSEQPMDPAMFGYSAYQQPYYYPEQYGYSQYYDVSHMPQYEMYHADPHHASQAVYY
ncbi:hypothetical protein HYDPIDRAFT_22934 [Hydnomerulius pinastri MD-312]|nr:hypothetical protein HYDPIDRAFT_22934 [Hydnomerulius pinastri MD-312]